MTIDTSKLVPGARVQTVAATVVGPVEFDLVPVRIDGCAHIFYIPPHCIPEIIPPTIEVGDVVTYGHRDFDWEVVAIRDGTAILWQPMHRQGFAMRIAALTLVRKGSQP